MGNYSPTPHSDEIWHKPGLKWGAQARTHGLNPKIALSPEVTLIFHRPSLFVAMWDFLCSVGILGIYKASLNDLFCFYVFCQKTETELIDKMQFVRPMANTTLSSQPEGRVKARLRIYSLAHTAIECNTRSKQVNMCYRNRERIANPLINQAFYKTRNTIIILLLNIVMLKNWFRIT